MTLQSDLYFAASRKAYNDSLHTSSPISSQLLKRTSELYKSLVMGYLKYEQKKTQSSSLFKN